MCDNFSKHNIAILIATKNGAEHIQEQLVSIDSQIGVTPKVYVSDDASSDNTVEIILNSGINHANISVGAFGSSAKNFLHLILSFVPLKHEEFIFLSDQDDIWFPRKCIRAIEVLASEDAVAYSGSYCYMDGKNIQYVDKSRNSNGFDHIFGSPGPGFTFAFRREAFLKLQALISSRSDLLIDIRWHDWLLYFVALENGFNWIVDNEPMSIYRLHSNNDTGQARNLSSIIFRLKFLLSGDFRRQILKLGNFSILPKTETILALVEDFGIKARFKLIKVVIASRKKTRDRIAMLLWLFFSLCDNETSHE